LHTKEIAQLGILLGLIIILTTVEALLMPLPLLPPYVKPGLANIVTMYCVFSLGGRQAVLLNALKALFVLLTRGAIAGLLSLCGGMLSVAVIILLAQRKNVSYASVSISGACVHNMTQLAVAALLLSAPVLGYYLPVLIISGIVFGLITGAVTKIITEEYRA